MTGDATGSLPLLLLLALQLLSALARNSCRGADATVSPATIATACRPSCSMACLAASRAATLAGSRIIGRVHSRFEAGKGGRAWAHAGAGFSVLRALRAMW